MSKVWFSALPADFDNSQAAQKLVGLYEAAGFRNLFSQDKFTALKIHFGEKKNIGYINPLWIKPLVEKIKKTGCRAFLTDTNTLYRGQRENSVDHIMQAYEHGFDTNVLGVPIIIADGLLSKNYSEVAVFGKHFQKVKIANDILHCDSMAVFSHVTGHDLTGLGAAVKNLGMGSAPRSGKQNQHADVKPKIIKDKCTGCGTCVEWCPVDAIHLSAGKAVIDTEKCYGCAECIATCCYQAVEYKLVDTSKNIQEKMTEYALGSLEGKKDKTCFFSFLTHFTKSCDCIGKAQEKVCDDIGILASYDPVSIDRAAAEIIKDFTGEDLLLKYWPDNDYNIQLNYAEKMGLGSNEYELIDITQFNR